MFQITREFTFINAVVKMFVNQISENIGIQFDNFGGNVTRLVTFFSQGSDISNFMESDQKVAPYLLYVFWVTTAKSDFLLIGAGTITPKGSINTANFGKTSLFVEQDYKQQTSTRL